MRNKILLTSTAAITLFVVLTGGCGSGATTSSRADQINTRSENSTNVNAVPVASPSATAAISKMEANEPEEYSATIQLTARAKGTNTNLAPLTATVAREGEKRRLAFNLPSNEQVVYMNLGNARYIILPNRKQYAEISPNTVGFEMPRLMMPDQIVDYLEKREGFERIGEEQFNGRTAVKYKAAGTTQTNSPAGKVSAESFTFVDKETGLPLRTEIDSQTSGNVQGIEGLTAVIEMRDIKTENPPALFEVPEGYNKISEEQIKNQVSAVTQAITAIAGAFMNSMNAPNPAASPK